MFWLLMACTEPGVLHVTAQDSDSDLDSDSDASDTDLDIVEPDCETLASVHGASFTEGLVNGSGYLFAEPAGSPKALVLSFHGSGGSMNDTMARRIVAVSITNELLARNYAVASLDSVAHLTGAQGQYPWSEQPGSDNPDINNVLDLLETLRSTSLTEDTPLVVLGVSNGGTMASRVAQFTDVEAAIIYVSNAQLFFDADAVIPPVALIAGRNDFGMALTSNQTLTTQIQSDGGEVLNLVNEPEVVPKGLFTKIPGVECQLSESVWDALHETGWLDEDHLVTRTPRADVSFVGSLPLDAEPYALRIRDLILEAYADHSPTADLNQPVLDFVDSQL
jgi:predicted esterase